jgi:hypothetical protein
MCPFFEKKPAFTETGIALQFPLLVMGLKKVPSIAYLGRGAPECVRTFFHSIDQTGILRPKGWLDRQVNEDWLA